MINGLPRILVIEIGGPLDVCGVVPPIHLLREEFPHAQLDVVVSVECADLVADHPCLDKVMSVASDFSVKDANSLGVRMRDRHYDIVIDFSGTRRSALVTWRSGAEQRIGFGSKRARTGVGRAYTLVGDIESDLRNRGDGNLRLAGRLCQGSRPAASFLPVLDDFTGQLHEMVLPKLHGGKRVAAIAVGSEDFDEYRPILANLGERLGADGRFEVLVAPLPGCEKQGHALLEDVPRCGFLSPACDDLQHYVPIIDVADVVITHSILAGQIAFLLSKHLLALGDAQAWKTRGPWMTVVPEAIPGDIEPACEQLVDNAVSIFQPSLRTSAVR